MNTNIWMVRSWDSLWYIRMTVESLKCGRLDTMEFSRKKCLFVKPSCTQPNSNLKISKKLMRNPDIACNPFITDILVGLNYVTNKIYRCSYETFLNVQKSCSQCSWVSHSEQKTFITTVSRFQSGDILPKYMDCYNSSSNFEEVTCSFRISSVFSKSSGSS